MRLTDLDIIVTAPCTGMGWAVLDIGKTDNGHGHHGLGRMLCLLNRARGHARVITDVFSRYFLNENPENVERMFRRTFSSGFTQRPDLTVMGRFQDWKSPVGIFWARIGIAPFGPCWAG